MFYPGGGYLGFYWWSASAEVELKYFDFDVSVVTMITAMTTLSTDHGFDVHVISNLRLDVEVES